MKKVTITITNSANDDKAIIAKICKNAEQLNAFITPHNDAVNDWNKPEPGSYYGGKVSVRYIDVDIEEVDDDTDVSNLSLKQLRKLLKYNKKMKKKRKKELKLQNKGENS